MAHAILTQSNYFSSAGVALINAQFGQGTGQIVLDDVQCSGRESQLLDCTSAPILTVSSNCDHSDDAGVRCEGLYLYKKSICMILQNSDEALCNFFPGSLYNSSQQKLERRPVI